MIQSLQAVFENGVLRPLEPLALQEHQQVTLTVSGPIAADRQDHAMLQYFESEADDSVSLETVRAALSKITGSMRDDFASERDERF